MNDVVKKGHRGGCGIFPVRSYLFTANERRLHRIDHRIAEGEILLLRSADDVFLAGIADADGDVVRRHGKIPIMVYVMEELKDHAHRT